MGVEDARELSGLVAGWKSLYDLLRPDLIVFDHAPIALLAARGYGAKRVVVGSGFCVPPDQSPLPNLRSWMNGDAERLAGDEGRVLDRMNQVLGEHGQPSLERVTQVYGEVDETFLLTYRELDHYPDRPNVRYWGAWADGAGEAPQWPQGIGKRIYAYLKSFAALPHLLGVIQRSGHPSLIVLDGGPAELRHRFACSTLSLADRPLDLARAGRECDLALLNGGHGTTASMLLAGKPILQIPLFLEQGLMSRAMVKMGAGLEASHKNGRDIETKLMAMLASDQYGAGARAFAAHYADLNVPGQNRRMVDRMEGLLQGAKPA